MRRIIDRDTYDRLNAYERTTGELEKENNLYKGFIKAMGDKVEKMFDDYVEQEQRKKWVITRLLYRGNSAAYITNAVLTAKRGIPHNQLTKGE